VRSFYVDCEGVSGSLRVLEGVDVLLVVFYLLDPMYYTQRC
jgi:hypothetical protein